MTLRELMENISYRLVGESDLDFSMCRVDAVTARLWEAGPFKLFVCVRTALGDGHDEAVAAYGQGCRLFLSRRRLPLPRNAAVLTVEEPEAFLGELAARCLGYPARHLTVIGITGTAGKSTVAYMTASLLRRTGQKVAMLTTDGVQILDRFYPAGNVVPDAAEIQRLLYAAVKAGASAVIIELTSYMLARKSAFSIPFTALLFTNFQPCHIGNGGHKNLAAYRAAKESLFSCCDAPFWIIPAAYADAVKGTRARCVLFGAGGDLIADDRRPYADARALGTRFCLRFPSGKRVDVSLPVAGDFAVDDAVAAAALALVMGLSPTEIGEGLSHSVPCGRMECIAATDGRYILADSAYTGEDLARALQTIRPYTKGRLLVLVGAVGGRACFRRAALGELAVSNADAVYFTADDPDCEDPVRICREMTAEVEDPSRYVIIPDRREAILRAVGEMRRGDILLLAGKGAQKTQLIRSVRLPFDEREIIAEALPFE